MLFEYAVIPDCVYCSLWRYWHVLHAQWVFLKHSMYQHCAVFFNWGGLHAQPQSNSITYTSSFHDDVHVVELECNTIDHALCNSICHDHSIALAVSY